MVSFEEAYKKAKEVKEKIDGCTEYENGYVFWTDLPEMQIGGPDSDAVVLKEDGRIVNMVVFMMQIEHGKEIGDIPLPEEEN